ncbi:hypothetical protein F4677DRAFT_434002 [Hypoxylon crocopeplum]|nr:hypothetical protein F4677DRAFT_434002 [Hypoxylon crocopeplum]
MSSITEKDSQPHTDTTVDEREESEKLLAGADARPQSAPCTQAYGHEDGKADFQHWVVVERCESDNETPSTTRGSSYSAHFDITLGRGRWQFQLCSFDLNMERKGG